MVRKDIIMAILKTVIASFQKASYQDCSKIIDLGLLTTEPLNKYSK